MILRKLSLIIICIVLFNEFLIYYFKLLTCQWPRNLNTKENGLDVDRPLKALILADTHMLGPFRGHWLDKLRREWQMNRSFQSAITIFQPEVVFFLGDLFDEGEWVSEAQFQEYVQRFHKLFAVPNTIQLFGIVGNHDVGFHYKMHPSRLVRFEKQFKRTGNSLVSIRGINFVLINSMTMERDGCRLCHSAEVDIRRISKTLNCTENSRHTYCKDVEQLPTKYSHPILLQHFPTYRESDRKCREHDAPNLNVEFRERWEVVSKDSTDFIGQLLRPRLAFSGHSHHYCLIENRLNIDEYTLASFNWRNKDNPSFALATFTPTKHSVHICYLPSETTIHRIYFLGIFACLLVSLFPFFNKKLSNNRL